MALSDCFLFQLAWKTPSKFGDVLVQRWHRKKSRFERLSPLLELPVPRPHHSGSVVLTWAPEERHSRRTIHLTLEQNASLKVDNKMREWSDVRLSSSTSPSGVIFEAGSMHRWVGYMYRHWAFARTTQVDSNYKSIPFTEPTKESNCCSSYFYTLLIQTRKSSLRTVLNPQLWPWGERLQHEKQTDLFRNLKFHDWLVTADHQTKLTRYVTLLI